MTLPDVAIFVVGVYSPKLFDNILICVIMVSDCIVLLLILLL